MSGNFLLKMLGYAATGLAAGLLGGLLGIGGGAITVPSLNLILDETMHLAIAASLFSMVFISASSAYGHWRNGYVLKNVVVRLVPFAALSAVAGVAVGGRFPGWVLRRIFALFLVYVAGNMIYKLVRDHLKNQTEEEPVSQYTPPNKWVTPLIAIPMGFSCGVLGIGGGVVAVPALHVFLRLPLKNAIANSSATILFSATVAAVAKMISINGMSLTRAGGQTLTLYWYHAVLIGALMAPTALVGGRIGSYLTRITSTRVIRAVFAIVLLWGAHKFWMESDRPALPLPGSPPPVTGAATPGTASAPESPAPQEVSPENPGPQDAASAGH